jgi:EpsI family protein
MTIPFAGRLLIAAGSVIAVQLPVWQIERQTAADADRAKSFDVGGLPMQLGSWTGVDTEIDKRLIRNINAFSTLNRSYENAQGRQILVHLATFASAEVSLPHPPGLCYKSAGWDVGSDRTNKTEETLPYRSMIVDRDGERAVITYWYQMGQAISTDRNELRGALQRIRWKGERWAPLVKVLLHVPVGSSDEIGQTDAAELGSAIFDWIKTES